MRIRRFKKRYISLGLIVIYVVLQFVTFSTERQNNHKFKIKDGFPLVISHRGGKDLFPENTAYAFEQSVLLGVDALELDVHLTKDNQVVTIHDDTIDRTSDGTGYVKDYTYEELKQFNFGAKFTDINGNQPFLEKRIDVVPITVEELFQKYAHKTLFIIEIKEDGERGFEVARQLKNLIEKYNIVSDVNVATFHNYVSIFYKHGRNMKSPTTGSQQKATDMVYSMYGGWDFAMAYGFEGMQLPTFHTVPLDTEYLIFKMRKHGMFVHYWTINDEATMKSLIAKKVDGIITDRPDIQLKLKEEANARKR